MTRKMEVLCKRESAPGLWRATADIPKVGANDIRIRIKKTAICGTDLHIYNWDPWAQATIKTPLIIGHEFAGIVESVGSSVAGFKVGDRVSGEGHITCGHCRNCRAGRRHLCRATIGVGVHRQGCFAEYLVIPASNAFRIPDSISDDTAAIFDPLGNAVHATISFDLVGEDVLITGAGPIGIMSVAIARHVGARHIVITDVNPYRLQLAEAMGASICVNVAESSIEEAMTKLNMSEGFDVGLEMSGHGGAFTNMIAAMNHGGRLALLGLFSDQVAIDWSSVIFKGLFLKGIYGREMYETWYKMASLLQSGLDLGPVITHHLSFQNFEEGFSILNSGKSGKVILDWES